MNEFPRRKKAAVVAGTFSGLADLSAGGSSSMTKLLDGLEGQVSAPKKRAE
jgi:hypothetical protein